MGLDLAPFDAADYLDTWDGVEEYLIATLEDGSGAEVAKAFQTATRAAGAADFAERLGLSPDVFRAAFSSLDRFDLPLMSQIVERLGWRLAPVRLVVAEAA